MARRTKLPRPSAPAQPDPAEREYLRNLRKYAKAYQELMRAGLRDLLPALKDAAAEDLPQELVSRYTKDSVARLDGPNIEKQLRALFKCVGKKLYEMYPDATLQAWAKNMVGHTNRIATANIVKTAKSAEIDIEPLMRDGKLTPYFQNVVDENVGLIRSIPEAKLASFKNKLVAAITKDMPQDQIKKMIQDNFDTTESQARLLARDQTSKLNGAIASYRQQQIGGRRYIWRTSRDSRVRDDHARLEGKTFFWDKPPVVDRRSGRRGNPGDDYCDRCWAEMVLQDVIK